MLFTRYCWVLMDPHLLVAYSKSIKFVTSPALLFLTVVNWRPQHLKAFTNRNLGENIADLIRLRD